MGLLLMIKLGSGSSGEIPDPDPTTGQNRDWPDVLCGVWYTGPPHHPAQAASQLSQQWTCSSCPLMAGQEFDSSR